MGLPLFPLLLLAFAVFNIVVYQFLTQDVYRVLSASLAVVCLVWGLALTHWSIMLLGLLFLLWLPRQNLDPDLL
jgi:hypothetical protein